MKICKNCGLEYETGKFCKKCGNELVEKEEPTLVCDNCGKTLDLGVKFCPECGTKVAPQKLVCSVCGMELNPGVKFCPECGTKVGTENKDEKKAEKQTNHTSSVLLDVTLTYVEKNKKKVISALESYGFSYENAEEIVECVPFTIKESIPEEEALSIKETLEDLGAEVELEYAGAEEQFIQVILKSVGPSNLETKKLLQDVCKYKLKKSKNLLEKVPAIIKEARTKYEAEFIKNAFESVGAAIELVNINYVDLGLPSGTLWAECNVGATSPEDFGEYFAWGQVNPSPEKGYVLREIKFDFDMIFSEQRGITDSEHNLTTSYDAASKNWGNKWRMPTRNEFTELNGNCKNLPKTINGIDGYEYVGKNGNSLFLPLEDCCDDNYWTSTRTKGGDAYSYRFGRRNNFPKKSSYNEAYSIRPVFRKACKRK